MSCLTAGRVPKNKDPAQQEMEAAAKSIPATGRFVFCLPFETLQHSVVCGQSKSTSCIIRKPTGVPELLQFSLQGPILLAGKSLRSKNKMFGSPGSQLFCPL